MLKVLEYFMLRSTSIVFFFACSVGVQLFGNITRAYGGVPGYSTQEQTSWTH